MAKRARKKLSKRPKNAAKRPKKAAARRPARKTARKAARRPARKAAKTGKTSKGRTRGAKKSRPPVETLRTPPSSLDMNRGATAARSGHEAIGENHRRQSSKMDVLTAGDVDADAESAYFTGDETPGGENPTPDQSDVDDLGHSVGVEYQDNQELQGGDEIVERDKHRWDNE